MATHNEIERILCERLKKTDTPNHQAIALVGDWGIGKTFLWQRFYENHKTSLNYKKYAYISLFGISSLEELKLRIATEIVSTDSGNGLEKDIMPNLKKLGGLFSTARLSDNGVSVGIGSSVMSGLVLSSLKDTLVCLDDLERRSKNLPIDEVMGLVNYLTQEKNCSVVCLLNRGEIKDEQYDNYKEKVFTYELTIDDSLELVLEKSPKDCHDVVKQFYDIFGIKNIRFYEKVFERYNNFTDKLNVSELSAISKESILSSFLLILAFDMMPKLMGFGLDKFVNDYSEENYANQYILSLDKDKPEYTSVERKVNDLIKQFVDYFKFDKWQLAIYQFMRDFRIDPNIATVIDEDLFTEASLANKRELDEITDEYYNLQLQPKFSSRLTKSIKKNLRTETYGNISHWCEVLGGMGEQAKASEIEALVKQQIDDEIESYSGIGYLDDVYPMGKGNSDDKFYDYIKSKLCSRPYPTKEQIIRFFIATHQNEERKISEQFINQMTKEELRAVIWADLSGLKYGNRRNFIKSVITCYLLDDEQKEKFRVWAVEILQEKAATVNSEEKYVINAYLEWTDRAIANFIAISNN